MVEYVVKSLLFATKSTFCIRSLYHCFRVALVANISIEAFTANCSIPPGRVEDALPYEMRLI